MLKLQVPKVREGGYVLSFIEHRKRSEQALISVIQEAVATGVSTHKIESVLQEFGIVGVSAGQVSQLCASLDEKVHWARFVMCGWKRCTRRCAWMSGSNRWPW